MVVFAACFVACKVSWTDLQALCRRARVACIELEVNKGSFNEYEVEYVADYMKQNVSKSFSLAAPLKSTRVICHVCLLCKPVAS